MASRSFIGLKPGEIDAESCSFTRLTVNIDKTAILLNDSVYCGQTEARSFALPLCRLTHPNSLSRVMEMCYRHS